MADYRTVPTVCTYCGTGCGMLLEVSGGELIGVLPLKGHPVSDGSLCVKGWSAWEFVDSTRRLASAAVREGKGAEPREASTDEAIALVTRKLKETVEAHGPDSVAVITSAKCTNEENYLASKLARAVVGTNNIDHCARL